MSIQRQPHTRALYACNVTCCCNYFIVAIAYFCYYYIAAIDDYLAIIYCNDGNNWTGACFTAATIAKKGAVAAVAMLPKSFCGINLLLKGSFSNILLTVLCLSNVIVALSAHLYICTHIHMFLLRCSRKWSHKRFLAIFGHWIYAVGLTNCLLLSICLSLKLICEFCLRFCC